MVFKKENYLKKN